MPYIKANDGRREVLRDGASAFTAGELNYQMFYYIKHNETPDQERIKFFINQFLGETPNYQRYNDMTGALVRCYKEVIRRLKINPTYLVDIMHSYDKVIADYEDIKIIENGDVE